MKKKILALSYSLLLFAGCSGGSSSSVDSLFGGNTAVPILTSVPDQIVAQENALLVDVNNIQAGAPGNDDDMTYSCTFDRLVDGSVARGTSCAKLPDSTVKFDSARGILTWTPGATVLGAFEFNIKGTHEKQVYEEVFTVGVRLKFNGIGQYTQITGTGVGVNWTPNAAAQSYQIFKLNSLNGQFELLKTVSGGNQSGTTVTGLIPNAGYTFRVQAMDVLGNLDGNVVSRSFTTTELVRLSMSPASMTVAAGTSVSITVRAFNANGSPQTVGGIPLTPQIQSGTTSGVFSSVTDQNDGTYVFTFTPQMIGTPAQVEVTTNMSFYLENNSTVTAVPGPPSSVNSSLSLSSSTVISGRDVTVTAQVRDIYNNPLTDASQISFLKSGGGSTGQFGALTNEGNGVYSTIYTGITAGSAQTLRVAVSGSPLTPSASIQVVPGAPSSAQSTIAISAPTVISGQAVTVTATLRDLNSNPIPSGVLLTLNKSGGTSTGNFDSITHAGLGVYTTTYTGIMAGTAQTLSMTVDGVGLTPTVTVQVLPGSPSISNSSLVASAPTLSSGSFVVLTANLRDLNNNPIQGTSVVNFTKTGGSSTGNFTSFNDQGNGIYSIRYVGLNAGTSQTVSLTVNSIAFGLTVSLEVVPGSPSSTRSSITTSNTTVISGQSVTMTAVIRDSNGNLIPSGVLVGFSKTGGTSTGTLGSVTNQGAGAYSASYTGVGSGTAQTIGILIDGVELGPNTTVIVAPGAVNLAHSSLVISNGTVTSGSSVTLTATLRDLNSNPIPNAAVVSFTKAGGTSTGTFSSVVNQGGGIYTTMYSGLLAGTSQILKVYINGTDVGFSESILVVPGAPSNIQSTINVSSGSVLSGNDVTVTAVIRDANTNTISSGYLVGFSKTGGSSTGNFAAVVNAGNGNYTTTYSGLAAGSAQTIAILIDGNALGPATTITVYPGLPSNTLSTLTVSSTTVIAGQTSSLTATIRDAYGNPINTGLVVSFDRIGGTSVGSIGAVTNQGNGVYTAVYTGTGAGTANTVQANVNAAGLGPTRTIQVLVGAPSSSTSSLAIQSTPLSSGSTTNITGVIRDAYGNPITTEYSISFDAVGGSSTGDMGVVNNAGSGTFTTTYAGLLAGSAQTIRVLADGVPIPGLTRTVQVVPGSVSGPNSYLTIGNSTVQSGTSTSLTFNLRDANNNTISSGLSLSFQKSVGGSDGTISSIANNGNGNYSASYLATTQGSAQTITLVVNGSAVSALAVTATVTAGPPTQITILGPTNPVNSTACIGPYVVTLRDSSNNTTSSLTGVNIAYSSASNVHSDLLFSDSSCLTPSQAMVFPAMSSTQSFYYRAYTPQSLLLTLTPDGSVLPNSVTIQNAAVLAWIGTANFSSTMNGSGSGFVMDDRNAGFMIPQDTVIANGHLFVVDNAAARIMKFDLANSEFKGWLGHIGSDENLTPGCGSSVIGDLTTGWCIGGKATTAVTTVVQSPRGIGADSTYIYVAGGERISRYLQTTGEYRGWIGRVSTVIPPAGPNQLPTCTSPGTNIKTPGWCFGGTTVAGTGDGEFTTITDVVSYGGKLYAVDYGNDRIQKFDASSGAFEGWIGRIGTLPVSPGACSGLSVGDTTPTWCMGGTAQISSRYNLAVTPTETAAPPEGFYDPISASTDGSYLYVADYGNRRIVRVGLPSGTFDGWIGRVRRSTGLSPTIPAQTAGTFASTWIQGGTTNEVGDSTGLCAVTSVKVDGAYLFIADSCHRIVRVNTSDGQDFRWIGRASSSPTGGFPGCSSTPVNGATPGWCLNGAASRVGVGNTMFVNPNGLESDTNFLYVVDRDNFRIQKFNKITGEFVGWIGSQRITSPTWRRDLPYGFARAGYDDYSFSETTNYALLAITENYLFIPDPAVHRIKKYIKSTGEMLGYVGTISGSAYQPIAPDNCVGATSGMTPDWCRGGGRTSAGNGIHGYDAPFAVGADENYVYVASFNNHRIDRVRISDGVYMGWIGRINAVPTDGDSSCLSASINDSTPTWCIGGNAKTGTSLGNFASPRGVMFDSTNSKLYVTTTGGLSRVNPSTGVTEAVIGHITAGSGCTISGSVPQGWCTSLTTESTGTNNYGGLNDGTGIASDATYLYVTDTGSNRIHRFVKSTGAPAGFIGLLGNGTNLDTTATGMACQGMTATPAYPKPAPGWCKGTSVGVALTVSPANAAEGAFNQPRGIVAIGGYLYIADSNNHRLVRIDASNGAFAGWKGYIRSNTNMMDADCIAAASTTKVTPKWCTGGTSGASSRLGAFDYPTGLSGDANYLYVFDGRNNRMVTVPRN